MHHFLSQIVLILLVNLALGQETEIRKININSIAPNLAKYTTIASSAEDRKERSVALKQWIEDHYNEYDAVRTNVLSMFLDKTVILTVNIDGSEVDASEIYNLEGWEMNIGYTEEQVLELRAKMAEYKNRKNQE